MSKRVTVAVEFHVHSRHPRVVRVLPVIERELLSATRHPWTVRLRLLFAASGLILCLVILAWPKMSSDERGFVMLLSLGILGLVFALLSGSFLTADCVSQEKREGTLGLLFLTPLRSRDILLGKLVSHSLQVFYGLLALFPLFFLPVLSGGILWSEVLRVILTLLVTLFLSLSLGLLFSVLTVEAKTSVLATFVTALSLTLLPLLYLFVITEIFRVRGALALVGPPQLSPAVLLMSSFEAMYQTGARTSFWGSVSLLTLLCLACFAIACALLPSRWRRAEQPRPMKITRPTTTTSSRPSLTERTRAIPNARWPYEWIALRGARESVWFRLLRSGLFLLVLGMTLVSVSTRLDTDAYIIAFLTAFVLHLITKLMFTLEATRPLNLDHRSGALELILVTPQGAHSTLSGAHRAYLAATRRPLFHLVVANLSLLSAAYLFPKQLDMDSEALTGFTAIFLGGMATAYADRAALGWVGFRRALLSSTQLKATLLTLAQVMLPSWILFGITFLLAANGQSSDVAVAIFTFWVLTSLVYCRVLTIATRGPLNHNFRKLASLGDA